MAPKSPNTTSDSSAFSTRSEDLAARRSDLAQKSRTDNMEPLQYDVKVDQIAASSDQVCPQQNPPTSKQNGVSSSGEKEQLQLGVGSILEAAFVDPAYSWPPAEGQGKYAIELKASVQQYDGDGEDGCNTSTGSEQERLIMAELPVGYETRALASKNRCLFGFGCCNASSMKEAVVSDAEQLRFAKERRHSQDEGKLAKVYNKENNYGGVPEGILIYRLNTSTGILQLLSKPHGQTNTDTLLQEMHVVEAHPSKNKSRRGIDLVGHDGRKSTLIACEQRTATAWLEAMRIMFAKMTGSVRENKELDAMETSYMNLANFSHKLIRAGALPGTKKGSGGAGGVYYSVEKVKSETRPEEEEALEAIAKRRAVIKDSWDFYLMICSLLRDRAKYDEVFRKIQLDPVYPYLNSMTGLSDPGGGRSDNIDKQVIQRDLPMFRSMTKLQVACELVQQAETTMPSLVEICKALAGSLGLEEVGVGPIKEPESAIRKAEQKYGGDILKVTDFCRVLLVVKDIPSLLALLELARDSFGQLIRRVKMSSLKQDHSSKPGGYRDCIINVELKGHICEMQIHLWPMWVVCGVDGFRHYRHCVEYNTDSFEDALDALDGLDQKTVAELIVVAEESVSETPLENLEWFNEKNILDYFAEAGLFIKHKLYVWAEIIFRHLIRLRTECPDIGPDHHATILLYKYLVLCLRAQEKNDEAQEIMNKINKSEVAQKEEKTEAMKSNLWDALGEVYDMVVDPSRKERESEDKVRKEVKLSKKRWRKIRQERFPFLDVDVDMTHMEEKKDEGSSPY